MNKLIKQTATFNSLDGLSLVINELPINAENDNQFVITEFSEFRIIQKSHAPSGGLLVGSIYSDKYEWSPSNESVVITRYKLDDNEDIAEFYDIVNEHFADYELTGDIRIDSNGEIESIEEVFA